MPPLVHYKFPIIGHTIAFLINNEEFLNQCKKEHGDIFSLYLFGSVVTFVGKDYFQEVLLNDDSFGFAKALELILPMEAILKRKSKLTNPENVIKDYVTSKTKFYTERVQKRLYLAVQKYIGDCNEPKVIRNTSTMVTKIISHPIANVFVGEEISQYEEIINTFSEFTINEVILFKIPPLLDFIHPGLQNIFNHALLRLGINPALIKHQKILVKHIKRQVCKRLQEKEKYGDSWKRPDDLLQDLIEEEGFNSDNVNINYEEISDKISLFIFASIHPTSNTCANALINLASRPEYMQELYEEQLEVHKESNENGILPFEAFDKMKKLDSFIRETLRLSEHVISLPHIVLKDYTFSNGLQVPKGHAINIFVDDVHQDKLLQGPNPKSFEPFRHVKTNSSATKLGKDYLIFGGGKHACPGRHLAISEIKFFMHNVILKYNIRTASGKIEELKKIGPAKFPSNSGIIFENRNS